MWRCSVTSRRVNWFRKGSNCAVGLHEWLCVAFSRVTGSRAWTFQSCSQKNCWFFALKGSRIKHLLGMPPGHPEVEIFQTRLAWRRLWVRHSKCCRDYISHLHWKCLRIPSRSFRTMLERRTFGICVGIRVKQGKIDRWIEYLIVYFPPAGTKPVQAPYWISTCQ